MAEESASLPVRKLTSVIVCVDDAIFTVAMSKSVNESMTDFLQEIASDLQRKFDSGSTGFDKDRAHHKVDGIAELSNDTFAKIVKTLIIVPYEQDLMWRGSWSGTTGSLHLLPPDKATGPAPRISKCTGSTETATKYVKPSEIEDATRLRMQLMYPYVSFEAAHFLIEHLKPKNIISGPGLIMGAVMSDRVKSLLESRAANAWKYNSAFQDSTGQTEIRFGFLMKLQKTKVFKQVCEYVRRMCHEFKVPGAHKQFKAALTRISRSVNNCNTAKVRPTFELMYLSWVHHHKDSLKAILTDKAWNCEDAVVIAFEEALEKLTTKLHNHRDEDGYNAKQWRQALHKGLKEWTADDSIAEGMKVTMLEFMAEVQKSGSPSPMLTPQGQPTNITEDQGAIVTEQEKVQAEQGLARPTEWDERFGCGPWTHTAHSPWALLSEPFTVEDGAHQTRMDFLSEEECLQAYRIFTHCGENCKTGAELYWLTYFLTMFQVAVPSSLSTDDIEVGPQEDDPDSYSVPVHTPTKFWTTRYGTLSVAGVHIIGTLLPMVANFCKGAGLPPPTQMQEFLEVVGSTVPLACYAQVEREADSVKAPTREDDSLSDTGGDEEPDPESKGTSSTLPERSSGKGTASARSTRQKRRAVAPLPPMRMAKTNKAAVKSSVTAPDDMPAPDESEPDAATRLQDITDRAQANIRTGTQAGTAKAVALESAVVNAGVMSNTAASPEQGPPEGSRDLDGGTAPPTGSAAADSDTVRAQKSDSTKPPANAMNTDGIKAMNTQVAPQEDDVVMDTLLQPLGDRTNRQGVMMSGKGVLTKDKQTDVTVDEPAITQSRKSVRKRKPTEKCVKTAGSGKKTRTAKGAA